MLRMLFIVVFAFSFFAGKSSPDARISAAENFYSRQQFDSALVQYNLLVADYPDTILLRYNRGLCYYSLKRWDEAIEDFDRCLEQDSLSKDARYLKARALDQKGNLVAAQQELETLYAIDKTYDDLNQRIQILRLTVYLSRNWYYMIAMAVLVIIFLATVITYKASKRI